ncbi:hypothetical protein DEIPH_ctg032orf0073 [Deinococcus phoenicis]|uniref:Uncharacterized protein n=1 Tax=Deinococcus phoenicis TaxID=1476583 RepID=A0A016QPK2_9DEIO|nr:hypothetical protein [Deinococcus phoenicis]EYB67827.1 hypothetical protein DEIPH_ctg032orf0073 [Deinococcus phoenicis]
MNVPRTAVTLIAGLSAALIAYSAFYVRGDTGGVMQYLRERGDVRDLTASGAGAAQVAEAHRHLAALGARVADPDFALRMLPAALLLGLLVAWLVWRAFGSRVERPARGDVQERMVLRLAYRKGGRFTFEDLRAASPLSDEQVQAVTRRMLDAGRLTREGDTFRLGR